MKIWHVAGIDLSLNHAAATMLRDGELVNYAFITDIASDAKKQFGTRLNLQSVRKEFQNDRHRVLAWRINEMSKWLRTLLVGWAPDRVVIEDYALRAEHGAHQMGEIGGVARWMCYNMGIPFRLHDPTTLKMFAAHDGTCSKDQIEISVRERWNVDFSHVNAGKTTQTSEDLCDAYSLSKLGHAELMLKTGRIALASLHEKEIRVFHRVTKAQPICLLEREWISK